MVALIHVSLTMLQVDNLDSEFDTNELYRLFNTAVKTIDDRYIYIITNSAHGKSLPCQYFCPKTSFDGLIQGPNCNAMEYAYHYLCQQYHEAGTELCTNYGFYGSTKVDQRLAWAQDCAQYQGYTEKR